MSAPVPRGAALELTDPAWRAGRTARRSNRRLTVRHRSPVVWLADGIAVLARAIGRFLRRLVLPTAVLASLGVVLFGGRFLVVKIAASEHFAVRAIEFSPTHHVSEDELRSLAAVAVGDRLLAIDPDAAAARIAVHPWVAKVIVRRRLPATLAVEVTEREAAAAVVLGELYLIDEQGHPFKRAAIAEAAGKVVLTGVSRAAFVANPRAAEAAFREALVVLRVYGGGARRPPLSEIHIDARHGFSLALRDSGAEVRLGRHGYGEKLARFDRILEALQKTSSVNPTTAAASSPVPSPGTAPPVALRVVHLDGAEGTRVSMRLAAPAPQR